MIDVRTPYFIHIYLHKNISYIRSVADKISTDVIDSARHISINVIDVPWRSTSLN